MRIVACGQDTVGVARFRLFYSADGDDVLDRVFALREQDDARHRVDPIVYLAVCYAAKEAILKTLDGIEQGLSLTDVVISSALSSRPSASLSNGALARARQLGIVDFLLTTSRTPALACAFAIARGP